MKRITYNGTALVTGSNVADALVLYVTRVAATNTAMSIDVPVLEENGIVRVHTLIVSAATQLEVIDIDGLTSGEENTRFPVPDFLGVGALATAADPEFETSALMFDEDPENTGRVL